MHRILFIVENNTVPPDIRVWREARTARSAGHSVAVIAPKSSAFPKGREVIDGIEIYRHPCVKAKRGKLNQVLEYANAMVWETLLCIRLYAKRRFHVIHAANPPDHVFLIALLFRPFGVKFIFDHHDLAPELFQAKFSGGGGGGALFRTLSLMESLSCRTAAAVISTNLSYKKHVMDRHGTDPEKIFVVRNDPEIPGPQRNGSHPERDPGAARLLYIGSINNQDGVDQLVGVVEQLVTRHGRNRVSCTVVGDGDDLPRVKELCAERSLLMHFTFTGYVHDRNEVRRLIEESDICLEPAPFNEANSRSTFIKIMEYMAAGKPVVAFDLDETRYSAGDSALLVAPGDLPAFADAVDRLIDAPSEREDLGRRGRRRITEVLNWQHSSKELIKAYAYVLGAA